MNPLTPRATRPVDLAAERLRAAILRGEPAAGERLPPERELAVTLGVSRLTLRAALARLEAEGLVRARQGDGVHVLDPRRHATLSMLSHLVLRDRLEIVRAFLELRRAIASEAVALACARMSAAAIAALAREVDAQRAERDDAVYAERDLEISRAVLIGADNFAMLLLLNTLESVYRAHPALAAALHADRGASIAGYDAVLTLLRAGDPARARELLRGALELADAAALERFAAAPSRGKATRVGSKRRTTKKGTR